LVIFCKRTLPSSELSLVRRGSLTIVLQCYDTLVGSSDS